MNNAVDRLIGEAARGFGQALVHDLAPEVESSDSAEKDTAEVYRDRNLLALALARSVAESHGVHNVGTYEHDEWSVVAVRLPSGVATWHMRPETVPDWLPERDAEEWFDGHTRAEKNQRVKAFAEGKLLAELTEEPADE